eukprot:COSAG05_NODE_2199_length_3410_cov_3.000906_1_plen_95_part_00
MPQTRARTRSAVVSFCYTGVAARRRWSQRLRRHQQPRTFLGSRSQHSRRCRRKGGQHTLRSRPARQRLLLLLLLLLLRRRRRRHQPTCLPDGGC